MPQLPSAPNKSAKSNIRRYQVVLHSGKKFTVLDMNSKPPEQAIPGIMSIFQGRAAAVEVIA